MSTSGESNNKHPPASSPAESKCIRHSAYYYEDGSTVFQAEKSLFKFQASLLKADPGVEDYKFEAIMKRRLESPLGSSDNPGSSDSNPIILPVSAVRFELFLMAILGRVEMPIVTGLFTVELQPGTRTPLFLLFYLATGLVASYFGMKKLEPWAWRQVRVVLESAESVAAKEWPHEFLGDLAEHIKTNEIPEFQHELLGMMQLVLSRAAFGPQDLSAEHRTAQLLFCAELYKTQTLATSNPALFGFVFIVILSLGHRSTFWTEHLTRDERTILYAAHADLTRLSSQDDLEIKWITGKNRVKTVCSAASCSQAFDRIWNKTFAQCKRLDSAVPLEDITQILTLPKYRFAFAKKSSSWECQSECARNSLEKIDIAMSKTFCGFTKKHEAWTRDA